MKERIKLLRKSLGLTLKSFGETLGIQSSAVSKWERGENNVPEQMIKSICREFNVDYIWLTTGEGEMFRQTDPDDEVLIYVSQLIDEKENPFFNIISETMHTYNQLTPENQAVLSQYCKKLLHNLQEKES